MSEVRKAKVEDAIEFAVLVKQFVKEASYPWKVDMDLVMKNFNGGIENEDFFFWVVEDEDSIVGFLVGAVNSTLFSHDMTAVELGWYVQPDYRNGRSALKLLLEFENWAKKKGCRHVTMVDIDTLNDLDDLYTRKGYTLTEKAYVKEI